ncbi:MAG: hypothetical protein CO093_07525 [Alphaproteobacteria bacterium CG_4_9_14_3_um_filter_47_13]|nr:MAG: hypothetical protein CO093_07525 [Alphaproteobacteria bacterium CG_4_9_14_3_um_filter_47_13]
MTDNQNPDAVRDAINAAAPVEETISEAVARLSALPPLEYERVRKAEAEKLGIDRVTVLDREVENVRRPAQTENGPAEMFPAIEPCSEAVDGAALLEEIAETIRRFIVCDPETVTAATLWIVFTWLIDRVQVAPLAVITAPEKRCGKSQLLDLIGRLSRRPLVASNISPAAIFRVIEAHAPTLLIDEADAFLKDNEEARGILNSGHTRQSAYVIRVVGEDHIPTQFSTWGAKAISGIGVLADTLMDRAVVLELRRKLPHENVQRLRHADPADFQRLTSMLARYSEDTGRMTEAARPLLPDSLNDRAQDNWEPLLAIADNAGGNWPQLAREAALKISGIEQESSSLTAELLADIREIFEIKRVERLSTVDLLQELNVDDVKPWATYNRGKPMNPRQLAKRLGEYRIKPQTIRMGTGTVKGFQKAWFDDAFTRYLSPPSSPFLNSSVTSGTSLKNNDNSRLSIRNSEENVTDAKGHSALNNKDCYGVTDAEVF